MLVLVDVVQGQLGVVLGLVRRRSRCRPLLRRRPCLDVRLTFACCQL